MIAAYMLEVHEGDLEWDIDGFRVKGLPEKSKSMKEIAWAAYNSPPPGMEPGLEAVSYYDPPNMTYPVRRLYLRDGHRRRYRRVQGAALLCARRLRHPHQPDDHRGPGARRPDRGVRHRHGPGNPLRRDRQRRGRLVHGLLPPDGGGDAQVGDRPYGHALAAPSDRRQGRRREPERRRRAGLLQCRERRLLVPRLDAHPDAARLLAQLGGGKAAWGCTADWREDYRRPQRDHDCDVDARGYVSRSDHRAAGRGRLRRRSRAARRAAADGDAGPPAAAGRRGRRRQDRGGQGAGRRARHGRSSACNATKGSISRPRSTNGTTSASCWRSARARARAPTPTQCRARHLLRALPAGAAAAGRHPPHAIAPCC